MLLASKFSLDSVSAVIKKYGKDLSYKERNNIVLNKKTAEEMTEIIETKLYKPVSYTANYLNFKIDPDSPVTRLYPISRASLDKLKCTACGSRYRVEMHHIRMMKDLNPKLSYYDRLQVKLGRKQMPLCKACHIKLHHGVVKMD